MEDWYKCLSDTQKGILFIATGTVLLLHALGIIEGLNTILIAGAVTIIVYGIFKAGYHKKILGLFARKENNSQDVDNED